MGKWLDLLHKMMGRGCYEKGFDLQVYWLSWRVTPASFYCVGLKFLPKFRKNILRHVLSKRRNTFTFVRDFTPKDVFREHYLIQTGVVEISGFITRQTLTPNDLWPEDKTRMERSVTVPPPPPPPLRMNVGSGTYAISWKNRHIIRVDVISTSGWTEQRAVRLAE